jgi:hypothetical protein
MVVRGIRCGKSIIVACIVAVVGPPAAANAATVQFGTYKGGASWDGFADVHFDSTLKMAVAGTTESTGGIASMGAYDTTLGGFHDGFVAQYGPAGTLNWSTYYGGSADDWLLSVAHNSSDQIYAGGWTESTGISLFGAGPVHQMSLGGGLDGLLVKFLNNGTPVWATYYGGTGDDVITDVCVGGDGSVFAVGYTNSLSGIAVNASHHASLTAPIEGFVAKFTSAGTVAWATYYGGDNVTEIWGCAVDSAGSVIIVGRTTSNTGIAKSAWDGTRDLSSDGFIAEVAAAGLWAWGTYYGGDNIDGLDGVAVDASNNIYVVGHTRSGNAGNAIAGGVGAYDTTFNGGQDAYFASFTTSGMRTWGSYYGGSGDDDFTSVAVDGSNMFMIGSTDSMSGIATVGSLDTSFNGGSGDGMYVVSPTAGGPPSYGMYLGGTGLDYGDNIAVRSTNDVALVGRTESTGNIATGGAPDTMYDGFTDVFLKYIQM